MNRILTPKAGLASLVVREYSDGKSAMAQCVYCKSETALYDAGQPICIACSEERDKKKTAPEAGDALRAILMRDLLRATARANAASDAFAEVAGDIPSGLPHPDGIQRIHNSSRELLEARKEVMKAHTRLNDLISRGIVPEDLKVDPGTGKD